MFKAILRLIVFHIFCRRLVCSNVIFSDLSRSHFGSCVRDLLTFLFTSVDCAIRSQVYLSVLPNVWFLTFLIRNDFMADLVFSMYYDNLSRWATSKNENISNGNHGTPWKSSNHILWEYKLQNSAIPSFRGRLLFIFTLLVVDNNLLSWSSMSPIILQP